MWTLHSSGMFHVSSLSPNVSGLNLTQIFLSKFIWKAKHLKEVNVFMWIHIQEKPNTCERLQRRFCPSTSFFCDGALCVRGILRIILIFFIDAPLLLLSELICYLSLESIGFILGPTKQCYSKGQAGGIWSDSVCVVLWRIWHERNQRIFEVYET